MKYKVTLNGKVFVVKVHEGEAEILDEYEVAMAAPKATVATPVAEAKKEEVKEEVKAEVPKSAVQGEGQPVNSPLPGSVVEVKVKVGDSVKAGDTLLIIEAMKMENEILAPSDGTVTSILCERSQFVNNGDVLLTIA